MIMKKHSPVPSLGATYRGRKVRYYTSFSIGLVDVKARKYLSENRLDRKRQSEQRKQQVNGVKRVEKIAEES